jgi:hypothetical protein
MVVGDKSYQLNLSRLAFSFKGSIGMEYLQGVGANRIKELSEHSKAIADEIKASGK